MTRKDYKIKKEHLEKIRLRLQKIDELKKEQNKNIKDG